MRRERLAQLAVLAAALALPLTAASAKPRDRHEAQEQREPRDFAFDPNPSTYRPLPREDLLITGATVLDGKGARIDDGDVLIRDGRVAAVGRNLERPAGVRVIDAQGRWVTPGIIDVHSHDGPFALPLTSIDAKSPDYSELSGPNVADTWIEHAFNVQEPSFRHALEGGVTTLQILPGSSPIFGGRSVVVKPVPATTVQAMKFPDAGQGLKMACGENPKTSGAEKAGPTSRHGTVAAMREAFLRARDYIADWDAYARGERRDAPRVDLKLDTLAAALQKRIPVHFHCYRADDMAVMMGLSREFGFRIAAFHHAEEAYKIAPMLREAGICSAVWADWWGYKMEASDGIRENAAFLDAQGACVMMHSDSPMFGQWLNIEAAKAAGAGRRAGIELPPERVIRWLTSSPAAALGLGDRIGALAPGYNADVVIWSGDPFSVYSHADTVLIDGAVAFDRRDPRYQPRSDFEIGRPAMEPLR